MADDDLPPRLPGQLDVYDCIRIAEEEEDRDLRDLAGGLGQTLHDLGVVGPRPKPRPLTAADEDGRGSSQCECGVREHEYCPRDGRNCPLGLHSRACNCTSCARGRGGTLSAHRADTRPLTAAEVVALRLKEDQR